MFDFSAWNFECFEIRNNLDLAKVIFYSGSNFIAGVLYMAIVYEIWLWKKELKSLTTSIIGSAFMVFLFMGGLRNLLVSLEEPRPWWIVVFISIPMVLTAAVAWLYLKCNRRLIQTLLHAIDELLQSIKNAAKEPNSS